MIKAAKKLKFWSRKKRKRRSSSSSYTSYTSIPSSISSSSSYHDHHHGFYDYYYQTPSTYHSQHNHHQCFCSSYSSSSSTQPSAPPLPPSWVEPDTTHLDPGPEMVYSGQAQIMGSPETKRSSRMYEPTISSSSVPDTDNTSPSLTSKCSYQRYMDPDPNPDPVYGLPVVETSRKQRLSSGFFDCVVKFSLNLIRCFCPCFLVREVS